MTIRDYKVYRQLDLKSAKSVQEFITKFKLSSTATLNDIDEFIKKETLNIGNGNQFKKKYKIGKKEIEFVNRYEDIPTMNHIYLQEYLSPDVDYLSNLDKIIPYFIKGDNDYEEMIELINDMEIKDAVGLIFFLYARSKTGMRAFRINHLNYRAQLYKEV